MLELQRFGRSIGRSNGHSIGRCHVCFGRLGVAAISSSLSARSSEMVPDASGEVSGDGDHGVEILDCSSFAVRGKIEDKLIMTLSMRSGRPSVGFCR